MKGLFLPEITTEDFRDGCLESIEALIGEGEIYDIDYPEPCEDCISRQAVLDATVKRNSIWNAITNSKGENLEEIISQLPPVIPKGVTVTDFADRCRECGAKYGKLLKQEPCEDAISREEVINSLSTSEMSEFFGSVTCGEFMEFIHEFKPVQPKVKTGHWVVDREAYRLNIRGKQTFDYSVHCDKCDYRCDYTTDVKGSLPSNYCPNCGADMRGDKKVRDKE